MSSHANAIRTQTVSIASWKRCFPEAKATVTSLFIGLSHSVSIYTLIFDTVTVYLSVFLLRSVQQKLSLLPRRFCRVASLRPDVPTLWQVAQNYMPSIALELPWQISMHTVILRYYNRIYVSQSDGGKGIRSVQTTFECHTVSLRQHLLNSKYRNDFIPHILQVRATTSSELERNPCAGTLRIQPSHVTSKRLGWHI